MTHSRQIITPIQWSLFFSLMWGRNWKQETLFWWCDWFSFDLTDSRGLSWSIHNGPDLSTAFCCCDCGTHHQRPFMAILNRGFFPPTRFVFSTSNKGADGSNGLPTSPSNTVPLCPAARCPIDSLAVILLFKNGVHASQPVFALTSSEKVLGFSFLTVAVILRGWPHWLHTGLYWVK